MRNLLLLVALVATPAMAADLTGVWQADVELDVGSGTATFDLKQSGETLTGTYSGQLGEAKVTGKVNGTIVEWSFEASPQGDSVKVTYSGTIASDGTVSGKCQYGNFGSGTFKATRKKTSQQRSPLKIEKSSAGSVASHA